ncbi:MAG: Ig-like domain-containing protein [Bacteroidales bacterium]|nr:Ig-like domain-containing protein [Bacteroidales bacterium]
MKKNLLLLSFFVLPLMLMSQSVFINEIHYDNAGTDAGEGIEIAGPVSTDLSGYQLLGYNGNGGTQYSPLTLSGTLADQENGFGTKWFDFSGLQNGDPDGIALVKISDGSVIQFLSYEGSFTANDGPASGMTSTDIGVMEPGTTTVGYSLQLSGTGNDYTDFTWQEPATATMGSVNTGQTLPPDDTPPLWAGGYPTLGNLLAYSGDLTVNLGETGTIYFMVLADGSDAPSAAEVKAGVNYGTVTVIYPGSFKYTEADVDQVFVIREAEAGTAYDIYVVAEDNAENLQTAPVLLEATTTSTGIKIISPEAGDTYSTGQTATFIWESTGVTTLLIAVYDYINNEHFLITEDGMGNPAPIDASLGTFTFTIPNDAPMDSLAIIMADADYLSVRDSVAPIYMLDALPPTIDELYPANNATGVAASYNPEIYFGEPVFPFTGRIYIREEGGALFEEFDVTVSGSGEQLEFVWDNYGIKISPSADFLAGTKYYIEMDAGVVLDYFDNPFAGIYNSTTWTFTIAGTSAINKDLNSKIMIYPVPVSTELTISGYSNLRSIEILDLTGSRVFSTTLINESEYKVDASVLPRGFYFLKLETEAGIITKKFIKK